MKALLFDLWDTIAVSKHFIKNFKETINIGPEISLKDFHIRLAHTCFTHPFQDYNSLVKAIFSEFGKKPNPQDISKAVSKLENFFINAELFPDSKYIWQLKENYKFALLTNTISPNFDEILELLNIENKFDVLAPSFLTNSIKPQPAIYQYALKKLKLNPQDTMMISDSIKDLDGAIVLDIHPLLIDRKDKHQYSPKIKSLKELPKYLEGFEWK